MKLLCIVSDRWYKVGWVYCFADFVIEYYGKHIENVMSMHFINFRGPTSAQVGVPCCHMLLLLPWLQST